MCANRLQKTRCVMMVLLELLRSALRNLSMKIRINGDHRDFNEPLTLAELVTTLGMKSDRVAVELNREIVQRTKWTETSLREGDKLEIVHFVGGGSSAQSI